jgi:hypothetical protein
MQVNAGDAITTVLIEQPRPTPTLDRCASTHCTAAYGLAAAGRERQLDSQARGCSSNASCSLASLILDGLF